ncbi:hypothetical protein ACIF85_20295 [Streptomyces sp. NPDC086033]|uniref:hypothetical protein n=1 Tax=Streptomyces sp. NPDC086033 TaxID=3365747 RepID=UPI0037D83B20
MAITGAAALLAAWEAGLGEPPVGRALLLHRTARPDVEAGRLLVLPVGEREADLFALRRALFGERMQVRLECAACGTDMEFDLDAGEMARSLGGRDGSGAAVAESPGGRGGPSAGAVGSLRRADSVSTSAGSPSGRAEPGVDADGDLGASRAGRDYSPRGHDASVDGPDLPPAGRDASVVKVQQDGWDVEFRLPGVSDLTAAARSGDPRAALLARCLVSAVRDGTAVSHAELPAAVQQRIAEAVEAADPGADLTLDVACPDCGRATRAELDIASYLWTELDSWARDVLLDVHLLATAYGWSEPEILALSPTRRRYYLELCADV